MIRAEDLMIGDWVMDTRSNTPLRVNPFLAQLEVPEWKPIPLTPEILEKNGFVNDNSVYGVRYRWESEDTRTEIRIYSPQSGYSGMTIIKNSYLVDEVSYDLPDVYMVHELQHALKLCGIEKEIEL